MAKYYATELATLKKKRKLLVEVNTHPILLTYFNDTVHAMSDKCPHLGASLEKGTFERGVVTCAKHHAQIDVTTGLIHEKAKILFLKMPTKKAKIYTVVVEGDKIFVEV